jgi:hypothetical protein
MAALIISRPDRSPDAIILRRRLGHGFLFARRGALRAFRCFAGMAFLLSIKSYAAVASSRASFVVGGMAL